jgi:hypothetical protein
MTGNPRFQPRWAEPSVSVGVAMSRGALLGRLEALIIEAQQQLRAFAEGRTLYVVYTEQLRSKIQRCLLDIGEEAREELPEINAIDFRPSQGLQNYYARKIFNDFEAPSETEKVEFVRLQKEYDAETPPKIQRMTTLLYQVRRNMLPVAGAPQPGAVKRTSRPKEPRTPYSERDQRLYELIGPHDLTTFTDAELWKRYRWKCTKDTGLASLGMNQAAFRSSLYRIRKHHKAPAPSLKKLLNKPAEHSSKPLFARVRT